MSPLQELSNDLLRQRQIRLFLKRDDLMNGACQGNKFRKLKYHLEEFYRQRLGQLVSFGGAFSNHLYALAALGYERQIPTVGFIRGEIDIQNPTIRQIRDWGMKLQPLDRSTYRRRTETSFLQEIRDHYTGAYCIPEGGHHPLAQQGVAGLVDEVRIQTNDRIDHWICPYGSGSTALGIASRIRERESVIAYVVLKGLVEKSISKARTGTRENPRQVLRLTEAHFGGFGKRSREIENFIPAFYEEHGVLLDPIYTARMFYRLFQQISNGDFPEGTSILAVHTGGLQGLAGYNYRFGTHLPAWKPAGPVH
jgi:1-aminocyclopropane-1-carboxylate deaminase